MNPRILVADDQIAHCELLSEILSAEGFDVITAGEGAEALNQFAASRPDLVLLDVIMPHFNGFDVCRMIKSNPDTRLTPVVLVTGLSAVEDRVAGIKAGADDFLTRPVDRSQLLARVRSLVNLKAYTDELERAEAVIFALARSIEGKDPATEGHCERLSDYATRLGKELGLPDGQITALRRAGVVHDVGKVAVPETILLKPGPLTPEEWLVMKQHPIVGERICRPLKAFRHVLPIIRHHHEKGDGTGYPDGLKGQQIPLTARILQIVDVYDALTTKRPYKAALGSEEALEIMEAEVRKGWWDGEIFPVFKHVCREGQESLLRRAQTMVGDVGQSRGAAAASMQGKVVGSQGG